MDHALCNLVTVLIFSSTSTSHRLTAAGPCAQVAILCNHQRSVPKGHAGQMEKLEAKTLALQEELAELQAELAAAKKGKASPGKKTVANVDTCARSQCVVGMLGGIGACSW